jgi:hypothetical protein
MFDSFSENKTLEFTNEIRGFVAQLLCKTNGKDYKDAKDVGLCADRLAISSLYAPLNTDTKFGCTHGFIELENISDTDIPLDGTFLHFLHPVDNSFEVLHLPLKGEIKAGGTYLIRCKQYADAELDSNVVINVDSYDQE